MREVKITDTIDSIQHIWTDEDSAIKGASTEGMTTVATTETAQVIPEADTRDGDIKLLVTEDSDTGEIKLVDIDGQQATCQDELFMDMRQSAKTIQKNAKKKWDDLDKEDIKRKMIVAGTYARDFTLELAVLAKDGIVHVAKKGAEVSKQAFIKKEEEQEEEEEEKQVIVNYAKEKPVLYDLIEKKQWDEVMDRLDSNPEEASYIIERYQTGFNGKLMWRMLPLHAVCYPILTNGPDGKPVRCGIRGRIDVVEKMIEIHPAGLEVKDDQGQIPLHHACRNGANISIVKQMLEIYPRGASVVDFKGRTPLMLTEQTASLNKEVIFQHLLSCSLQETGKNGIEGRDDVSSSVY